MFFMFFSYLKLKGELTKAYESYAGGNSYCYLLYLALAGSNEPLRVPPSTSSGWYRSSVSGGPSFTIVLVF